MTIQEEHLEAALDILADTTSGASAVSRKILRYFRDVLNNNNIPIDTVVRMAFSFIKTHSTLGQVINICLDLVEALEEKRMDPKDVASQIESYETVLDGSTAKAILYFRELVDRPLTILTLSKSSMVTASLRVADPQPYVIIGESRPNLEGVVLAKELGRAGIPVTLVADAVLPSMADSADMALVGCDAIMDDFFYNKVGTYPLALACQEHNIPMYVLATLDKVIREERKSYFALSGRPAVELCANPPPGVSITNYHFEKASLDCVKCIISELGILEPQKFLEIALSKP